MRTTIDIPDELYRRLEADAAQEGRSVGDLVLELIAARLQSNGRTREGKRVELPMIKAGRKGAFDFTREEIHEAMFG
jgi:hypothetical protein